MSRWSNLTAKEVIDAFVPGTFSMAAQRRRRELEAEIAVMDDAARALLTRLATEKRTRTRRRTTRARGSVNAHGERHREYDRDPARYLQLPSDDQWRACIRAVRTATANAQVSRVVCVVCARERFASECRDVLLSELPSRERLVPGEAHRSHRLFDGMLLELRYVRSSAGGALGSLCGDCEGSLRAGKRPRLSLANNMWLGDVPEELQGLTVPEQMLIALQFARCYVFKLFPRNGHVGDPDLLQSGLAGNVTTFPLNNEQVVQMVEGQLLPRPLSILSSVIAVTFVGVGRLPKRWLKSTFRVRRVRVHAALRWLKDHNPMYLNMDIADVNLRALPEDGVPLEILSTVLHERNGDVVDEERAGYVPDAVEDGENEFGAQADYGMEAESEVEGSEEAHTRGKCGVRMERHRLTLFCGDREPDVVALQHLGVHDTDMSTLSSSELMMWALANAGEGREGGYAVRHGWRALSTFGQTLDGSPVNGDGRNPLAACFPTLFPYGIGGIEQSRDEEVHFLDHVRWCLEYCDKRFRTHHSFYFVAFGIQQRREVMRTARVQMKRKDFDRHSRLLRTLTLHDLRRAEDEERRKIPISDDRVAILKKNLYSASAKVTGSDAKRASYAPCMWGTTMMKGPSALFVTVNQTDLDEPVVQVFAGEAVDMDNFQHTLGPDERARARNVALDPFAAALAFKYLSTVLLEHLWGVKRTEFATTNSMGVLGFVEAYFGVVEAQGRGTLHLHMIVWLKDAPTAEEMDQLLKDEAFREKVKAFIRLNIRAHIDGLGSKEEVDATPRQRGVGFCRPPDPDGVDFEVQRNALEKAVVRSLQVHTCKRTTCLRFNKNGKLVCKRRAPFRLSDEDWIDEKGNWGSKRAFEYMNSWNPAVTVSFRCNNDMKLTMSGRESRAATWYMSKYTTKRQEKTHNRSALLARAFAYHEQQAQEAVDARTNHRLLLSRCLTTLNREQELSGPQVISYLMGWGDSFRSHNYTPIFWSSFVSALKRACPELRSNASAEQTRESNLVLRQAEEDDSVSVHVP